MGNHVDVAEIRRRIEPVLRRHGVQRAGLFGSAVRGELKASSDVDVLVELGPEENLLDLVELKLDLESVLGRRVDVVEYRAVHPLLQERIMAEQIAVL